MTRPSEAAPSETPTETTHEVTDVIEGPSSDGFDDFCRAEHASMVNALSWALGQRELGTEAADEAFARAYERWDRVSDMNNPAGWVYRVGLNWGRRRIWRRNRERELVAGMDLDLQHDDVYVDPDLADAIGALPVKFRSVVVLRYLLGYSERETAEALDISPGTAKSRMSRALDRLRDQLDDAPIPRLENRP